MSDSTNQPSLLEKVKDKVFGHQDKDTDYATTVGAVPVIPVVPVSAVHDSDLNRDGHVSASEHLKAGTGSHTRTHHEAHTAHHTAHTHGTHTHDSHHTTGTHDLRDQNRDGNVSLDEKIKGKATGIHDDEARLKLHEEQLAVSKREVPSGEVGISKRVESEHVQQSIPVKHDEVVVERRPLSGEADPHAHIGAKDEIVRVPLYHEEVVTEKRVVPTEEVIVHKKEATDHQVVGDTLRSEHVDMQTGTHVDSSVAHDIRDTNRDGQTSLGEKIKAAVGLSKDK